MVWLSGKILKSLSGKIGYRVILSIVPALVKRYGDHQYALGIAVIEKVRQNGIALLHFLLHVIMPKTQKMVTRVKLDYWLCNKSGGYVTIINSPHFMENHSIKIF